MGFDCEWVQVRGNRRPVALLQVATSSGVCVLVRLCHMRSNIPDSLKVMIFSCDIALLFFSLIIINTIQ